MFKNKKVISMLLALMMVVTILPMNVFAAGTVTSVKFEKPVATLTADSTKEVTQVYTAKVYDDADAVMDTEKVEITAANTPTGVTFDAATNTLKVASNAQAGTVKLTAKSITDKTKVATQDVAIKVAPPVTHAVKVTNGTASPTSAAKGVTITLIAKTAPAGQVFDKWTVTSGNASLADATKSTTTFVMPDADVNVTASYKAAPVTNYKVTVINGKATPETAPSGSKVTIKANVAPTGKVFDKWILTSGNATLASSTSETTTFTMPSADVTVTGTYKELPTPKTYTVTFYEKGGSPYVETQIITEGGYAKEPTISKSGYRFDGWYLNDSTKYNFNTPVNSNLVLTAHWTLIAPTETVRITDANVYYNKVTGTTNPYARVTLYKNDRSVSYAYADSRGHFEITNTFGYANNYYDGNVLYPNAGHYNVTGYTTANTYVRAYDGNGNYLGAAYSNDNGYYSISYDYVSNTSAIRVYAGNSNGYHDNGYYNLSDYKLIADKNGDTSAPYYLRYADIMDYVKDNNYYGKAAIVSEAKAGTSVVKGYNVDSYAIVTVKDSKGYTLGTATAYSNGNFVINTNRNLKEGEVLTIVSSTRNLKNVSVNYTVGKLKAEKNVTIFTIDSTKYTKRTNNIDKTYYMDIAPYGKSGRTMLPIRYVAESLGYTVTYNQKLHTATFINGDNVIIMDVFSDVFYINGVKHTFNVKPEIKKERTMLPIAEVAKALGLTHGVKGEGKNIEWNATTREVTISL